MRQNLVHARSPISDGQNVYAGVYHVLVAGMVVSNLLFGVGLVLALLHPQYFPLSARWVRLQYHPSVVLHELTHGEANGYFMIGTLLLILTPIVRVLVSIYEFRVDGDRKYVAVTGTVFFVIILTIVLGLSGVR
jgi:uncharacterized membrane protein